jgi:hypothetical protein
MYIDLFIIVLIKSLWLKLELFLQVQLSHQNSRYHTGHPEADLVRAFFPKATDSKYTTSEEAALLSI